MASQTWKIINAAEGRCLDDWHLDFSQISGAPPGASVSVRRLRGGLTDGVLEVRVNNGRLKYSVLPTRGMGIWKAWLDDLELGWKSPVRGPVHPHFVPLAEPSGLGWLDGFDELLCRCGLTSNGAPDFNADGQLIHALHGRVANRPAHDLEIEVEDDQIHVRGVIEETRFHFAKLRLVSSVTTRFLEPTIRIHDDVCNFSASDGELQLLYHVNFGPPLLGAGAEVVLPVESIVPRNDWAARGIGHWATYQEPTPGMPERVYFFRLKSNAQGQTQAMLKNPGGDRGVGLHFNTEQLPCFSLWKNETSLADGYVTGLEPGTNFPNPRSFESAQGRVMQLPPGGHHLSAVAISVLTSAAEVDAAEAEIGALQGRAQPVVFESPQPGWCDGA